MADAARKLDRRSFLKAAACGAGLMAMAPIMPKLAFATVPERVGSEEFQAQRFLWTMAFQDVVVEDVGAAYPLFVHDSITTQDDNTYTNVVSHKYPNAGELVALEGNCMRFRGAAYKDGTMIDMLASIEGYAKDFRDGYTYPEHPYNYFIAALSQDNLAGTEPQISEDTKNGAPLFEWAGFKYIDFRFRFVLEGTNTPFPVTGHFSLSDLDWGERVSFGQVGRVLVLKDNRFVKVERDEMVADLGERDNIGDSTVTVLLDDVSDFSMRAYQNPWKSALYCLDSTTNVNIVPDDPEKTVLIRGDE